MSQHPDHPPSSLHGEFSVAIGELVTIIADGLHAAARLMMLNRELAESTAIQSVDPKVVARLAAAAAAPVHGSLAARNARREAVLDLYATTDLAVHAIARQAGVADDTPRRMLIKARRLGDRRAAQGDLRRQPAADQAAPSPDIPSTPHDGLPENGGNASPEWPVEIGVRVATPAQGEEVVPAPDRGEELTTSDDPAPAPEPEIVTVDLGKAVGVASRIVPQEEIAGIFKMQASPAGRSAIDALRAANERIRQRPTEMELADELDPEPTPRRAEPEVRVGPAGLAQRVAARVERPQEPAAAPTPVIKVEVPTEEHVGLPILHVDKKAKTVTGPFGVLQDCTSIMLAVCDRLADGCLYGHEKIQQIAAVAKKESFDRILDRWKVELRGIGVEVYDRKGYGLRLHRREVA